MAMRDDDLRGHLERLDAALPAPALLHIYGSAALILLDMPDRTSLDLDVAGPYCRLDEGAFRAAAAVAGLPVNPEPDTAADHIEWISAARLCLPPPDPASDLTLWRGRRLTVKTNALPALIASKLIRYDALDRGDVQYLVTLRPVAFAEVAAAAARLPPPFDRDPLVVDNLDNFRTDLGLWRPETP